MYRKLADFIVPPLREAENQRREFLGSDEGRRVDWEVIAVLLATAFILTLQRYAFADGGGRDWPLNPELAGGELARHANWAILQIVAYAVAPFLVIRLLRERSLRDYAIGFRGVLSVWWVCVLMYLVMLPCVLYVSNDASFQRTYPFYRLQNGESIWPRLIVWEIAYGVQFFALEFFFRGFLLHGLKRRFGAYAILVMTVPYCMVHFDKPLLETLGSIVAGVVLGFLSLKTKSIWPGVALHIAVAWTMDVAALYQRT